MTILNHLGIEGSLRYQIICEAKKIGSDIGFFCQKENAFVEGTGDIVQPIKINRNLYILLVNPKILISTTHVYHNYNSRNISSKISCNPKIIIDHILYGKNDLEYYVRSNNYKIQLLINFLSKQKNALVTRMSGSGSTCFALFEEYQDLEIASVNVIQEYPNYWIHKDILQL